MDTTTIITFIVQFFIMLIMGLIGYIFKNEKRVVAEKLDKIENKIEVDIKFCETTRKLLIGHEKESIENDKKTVSIMNNEFTSILERLHDMDLKSNDISNKVEKLTEISEKFDFLLEKFDNMNNELIVIRTLIKDNKLATN